jgi:Flp pilus assembly CpaF family ATPase
MPSETMQTRHQTMLEHALGDLIREALAQPGCVEVEVNADGTVWHECYGAQAVQIGRQSPVVTEAVIRLVAALNQTVVHAGRPSIAGTLPGGQRFQGWVPPRTKAPAYLIRVPPTQVLTREAYVPACCSAAMWDTLVDAIVTGQTVLLAGGMSSGKTSLFNALMGVVPSDVRLVTIEDTAEGVITVPNHLQLYGTAEHDLDAAVKEAFRSAGRRLPVGEIRDGKTAIQALKLWQAVGGGLATIHASSGRNVLARLASLCADVSPGEYHSRLGEVIDLIVYLEIRAGRRQITDVLRVGWKDNAYDLVSLPL